MEVHRGEVFYADLSPVVGSEQGGVRPVLIVQNEIGNRHSPTVIAAAITSRLDKARLPTHINIRAADTGLAKDSVVLLEQIRTLDKHRLRERAGQITPEDQKRVDQALDEESTQLAYAKACGKMYHAPVFANGDTRKQLLARSIYLLYKKESLWTQSQRIRAEILFKEYPDIKKGYYLSMRLGLIYHQCKFKDIALTRLARWYDEVDKSGFLTFGRVARSIQTHYLDIINFFERRATNAEAESFNAKIKAFRAQFRGVRDRAFFLYRLAKLYA